MQIVLHTRSKLHGNCTVHAFKRKCYTATAAKYGCRAWCCNTLGTVTVVGPSDTIDIVFAEASDLAVELWSRRKFRGDKKWSYLEDLVNQEIAKMDFSAADAHKAELLQFMQTHYPDWTSLIL